ncbi:hypothetical protein DFH06DRAFT_124515 [Mycena polygramma]|nr:hypothetical protein DFH06DRAFT_124515 [Mycena polygramma]
MGFQSSRSPQDLEKNTVITNHKSILTRILAWILPTLGSPAPDQQPPAESNPSEESLPWWEQLPKKEPELPYSEAESRQASTKLWSIYIGEAERYDKALVESWKGDMEGMLIFSGLFSASLTAFLIESYQTLQPDSGDVMIQLLSQISQQLGSNSSTASPVSPADPFQPTASSLVCNTFWFISLTLSITCALLATLVEQWAREFLHRTDKHPSPIRRARIFSFLYFGLRRFGMHTAVELIPLLLHISLILFLAGLVAFLLPVNHIMVGLIASILGGFLVIYAILTVLPVIRLDSPFKTPFSGVLWNLLHKLPKTMWLPHHSTSSSSNTMSDAMVEMALRPSEHRDQRAIKWTLESLTDDSELKPFLEAIPDAICGPGGFHRRNDGLFVHLLDIATNPYVLFEEEDIHRSPLSLSERITDFLTSCQNLALNDPARQHGLIVGVKCLWALGMISDTAYHCEYSGGGFWFSQKTQNAVSALAKDTENWPESYAALAQTAIQYSRMNNFRTVVVGVSRLTDPIRLVDGVQRVVDMAGRSKSTSLVHHTSLLSDWSLDPQRMEKPAEAQSILQSLVEDMPWVEASVWIVASFLLKAIRQVRRGCPILPAAYSQTCLRMAPVIDYIPVDQREDRSFYFKVFNASPTPVPAGQLSDLDHIMKMFLRLLPQLRPEDAIPGFASYLGKRNDLEAIKFATTDCRPLVYLTESLIVMLQPQRREDDILHSLCGIFLLDRYYSRFVAWDELDEQLWNYMTATSIFSNPIFSTLATIMKLRNCNRIWVSATNLVNAEVNSAPPSEAEILQLQKLSKHFVLPEKLAPTSDNCTPEEIVADIRNRATHAEIAALTDFLAAGLQNIRPMYMGDAARILFEHFLNTDLEGVDIQVLARFSQAWLAIVEHLLETPTDTEMVIVARWILYWAQFHRSYFRHSASAPLFKDTLVLHLKFLETRASEEQSDMQQLKQMVDELTA